MKSEHQDKGIPHMDSANHALEREAIENLLLWNAVSAERNIDSPRGNRAVTLVGCEVCGRGCHDDWGEFIDGKAYCPDHVVSQ